MAAFEYRQAEEIRDAFARRQIQYLFIGKSGAVLLGFPDTTQDADLFVAKDHANCERLVAALIELAFELTAQEAGEVRRGKDFIQLKNGPFDLDLRTHGNGGPKFKGFRFAASMTSWPASEPGSRFQDCCRSGTG